MLVAAIVVCEVGFWVVLAAGLLARYGLHRPRLGAALLICVPLVDLALLAFTAADLRAGGAPSPAHGLAAVYLGFSVVFGHRMVRWADVRAAHRWADGPPPEPAPAHGTSARVRLAWQEWARATLAAGIAVVLLITAIAMVGDPGRTGELWAWVGRMGWLVALWLLAGPLWEQARTSWRSRRRTSGPRSQAAWRPPAP
ncbi:hypothetical protein [Actinomycetospora chibensis]|uniref:Integral membrane protein n=1 Tax=Actinomycetospora chibensis TaxID=663606 RepID=A0ABV9RQL6_9PSEU|nr:hypothetical protein [Actinomycetospora chibensis]MDD7927253.1 hypothetical protein [Actinomycetospora chibensis]